LVEEKEEGQKYMTGYYFLLFGCS